MNRLRIESTLTHSPLSTLSTFHFPISDYAPHDLLFWDDIGRRSLRVSRSGSYPGDPFRRREELLSCKCRMFPRGWSQSNRAEIHARTGHNNRNRATVRATWVWIVPPHRRTELPGKRWKDLSPAATGHRQDRRETEA